MHSFSETDIDPYFLWQVPLDFQGRRDRYLDWLSIGSLHKPEHRIRHQCEGKSDQ